MRGSELLDKLSLVDSAYVEAAAVIPRQPARPDYRWAAVAACIALLAAVGSLWLGQVPTPGQSVPPNGTEGRLPPVTTQDAEDTQNEDAEGPAPQWDFYYNEMDTDSMAENHVKTNLADEIFLSLKQKIDNAIRAGIGPENIIVDPGIGFGKTREQNFELVKRIGELHSLGCLVMLGVSRKSLLDMQDKDNDYKDIFTVVLNALALERGVDYLRVHNVKLHRELINLMNKFNAVN